MSPDPAARRPRPGPGPRPRPRPSAAAPTPAPARVSAPGLAAFLRRHPRLPRQASAAAIAGGVALFAAAALTATTAGADVAAPRPQRTGVANLQVAVPPPSTPAPAPAVQQVLKGAPTHVKRPAPANHGVISGLAANGIPSVALNAYRVAATRMDNVDPGCGIDWALLAGIGREESDHGRFGGAVLHADGVSTPPIIGPALDGVHWDFIPAPANGLALDGDAKYAHALGPMQFIPSTWAIYGTDANGDGKADVFNINDAALGAARYLCAAGGNLRSYAGQVRAVLAYNHSDQYLAQVLALADAYRRGIPISGIPVGILTGALPTITDTGYIPPANPAAPTAASSSSKHKTKPKPTPSPTASSPAGGSSSASAPPPGAPGSGSSSSEQPGPGPSGSGSSSSSTPSPSKTCEKSLGPICLKWS
jgi:membrane-bound lytic murein transglycosylase B